MAWCACNGRDIGDGWVRPRQKGSCAGGKEKRGDDLVFAAAEDESLRVIYSFGVVRKALTDSTRKVTMATVRMEAELTSCYKVRRRSTGDPVAILEGRRAVVAAAAEGVPAQALDPADAAMEIGFAMLKRQAPQPQSAPQPTSHRPSARADCEDLLSDPSCSSEDPKQNIAQPVW